MVTALRLNLFSHCWKNKIFKFVSYNSNQVLAGLCFDYVQFTNYLKYCVAVN